LAGWDEGEGGSEMYGGGGGCDIEGAKFTLDLFGREKIVNG